MERRMLRLYKPRINGHTFAHHLFKWIETGLKSIIILLMAVPWAAGATLIWYLVFYNRQFDIGERSEIVSTAAWVPWLAVVCGVINASLLAKVLDEFKDMRYAIKSYDLETYMRLCDEDVSPLIYLLLIVFDICIVGGFMFIHYQDAWHGVFFVWTSAYVAALLLIVIRELDDPLNGVWFIKNVHPEWTLLSGKDTLKRWREMYYKDRRKGCTLYFGLWTNPESGQE